MSAASEIASLVDRWCDRRALHPLRTVLPVWPPPNGFTDEWEAVWAALRHVRAMCRDDLAQNGEGDQIDALIAELSQRLFPGQKADSIEQIAERLIAAIFGNRDT